MANIPRGSGHEIPQGEMICMNFRPDNVTPLSHGTIAGCRNVQSQEIDLNNSPTGNRRKSILPKENKKRHLRFSQVAFKRRGRDYPAPVSACQGRRPTYDATPDFAAACVLLVAGRSCRLLGVVWHHLQHSFSPPREGSRRLVSDGSQWPPVTILVVVAPVAIGLSCTVPGRIPPLRELCSLQLRYAEGGKYYGPATLLSGGGSANRPCHR